MGKSLFDKIQAKLELLRLEKRYTRSRHRRSAFVSNAVYVDGEYIYQNSTGSSTSSDATDRSNALHGDKAGPGFTVTAVPPVAETPSSAAAMPSSTQPTATAERKRLNRYSSMPGFGGTFEKQTTKAERRLSMIR
ncbi:unnamed protein product [Clonostachys rhizophaga]|uniref:Uncharacterized protein n=2 Tax=Clonostachys TaxID=110564 RepID=A0A9N9V9E9_9HYPO|nr:unnamed protein product [Clonostachys byssicola]CAH0019187.1 unnamed protein product [Clonostachys rhizophaga]